MKIWIVGLLILGATLPLVNSENDDDDYEIKRFHVQSRELGGSPTCVETRRKRSTSQSNVRNTRDTYGAAPADEDEKEIGASTGIGNTDSTSGILLQDSDLLGNAGVLVIRNQAASTPILFELRPVEADQSDVYYEHDNDNNSDASDDDDDDDDDDNDFEDDEDLEDKDAPSDDSEEVDESNNNENRYKPSADEDYDLEEDEKATMKKQRVQKAKKPKRKPSNADSSLGTRKPNKKRKRISNEPVKRKSNRRKNQSPSKIRNSNKKRKPTKTRKPSKKRNQNKNRKRRPSKKRYEYVYGSPIRSHSDRRRYQNIGNGNSFNRHHLGNRHDSSLNRNKHVGENVNRGKGEKTITKTITTTQTGTAADVNCIIITKEPTPTTQKPFWGILGRSEASEDRSFGHRKRFKNRFQFSNA